MTAIHLQPCHDSPAVGRHHAALDALNDATQWVFANLRDWRRRIRERGELAALDDRMLQDIGLTRGDAEFLANKPFWEGMMHAILARAADLPATQALQRRIGAGGTRIRRLLSTLAYAALERITSAQRDVPPEYYRFPPF